MIYTMEATKRPNLGTGNTRALRRDGRVPAVIYGDHQETIHIAVDPRDIHKGVHREGFYASLYDITLNGTTIRVLPKAVQFHPVNDTPLHVDFLRVGKNTMVTVEVPVHLLNQDKSKGLKMGGSLNIVRHNVQVVCPPDAIPTMFEIDIADAKIGDSIKSNAINLPTNVKFTITGRDFTIATIAAPRGMTPEEQAQENAAST
jgi:large subunit ribosomal protein L25